MKINPRESKLQTTICVLLLSSILLGCSFYMPPQNFAGAKPVYPSMVFGPAMGLSQAGQYPIVDSLQPTLQWSGLDKTTSSYDVCIREAPDRRDNNVNGINSWGVPIYEADNIPSTSHRVSRPLKPNTAYNWAVRKRQGNQVYPWSSYAQITSGYAVLASNVVTHNHEPFRFKTPAQ